jgi:hypothetical protein
MARTKQADPTPDEQAAQEWADTLRNTPGAATPAEEQQVERAQAREEVIEGHVLDMTQEQARVAAEWVRMKRYGKAMTTIIQYIAANALDTSELNAVIMEQMATRILAASTMDDILDPFGTVKGKDLLDKPLYVAGCQFLISTVGQGFPWYVAFEVVDQQTDSRQVVIVGGEKLVPQAAGLHMHNVFPCYVRIHENEKETSAGYHVLELQLPQGNDLPF